MTITPMLGSFAAISPLLEYLRPRRSPYLIPAAVGAFLICRRQLGFDGAPFPADFGSSELLFYCPVILIFALFLVLSIRYRDPTLSDGVSNERIVEEIDSQLKFSRALAIAVGISSLYYIMSFHNSQMFEFPVLLLYAVIIVHLATFLVYTAFYNIREEKPKAHAVFQIGALMSIALVVLTLAVPRIDDSDGQLATRCETTFTFEVRGKPQILGLLDSKGDARVATAEEIAKVALSEDEIGEAVDCSEGAPTIEASDNDYYDEEFEVLSVTPGAPETFVDERFVVSASFFAIWLAFEVYWLLFLARVIGPSVTVFRAAIERDELPPAAPKNEYG